MESIVFCLWKPLHVALSIVRPIREHYQTFTLPEHMSSLSVFSAVRVTRVLVLYVCFEQATFRSDDDDVRFALDQHA
jgi:hypothetical protein